MSDDERTPIPVLRQASADIARAARNEETFTPGDFQKRVKARFYRRIDEMSHQVDRETVFASKDLVVQMAGTDRIVAWLEDPAFASWFVDADFLIDTISSLQSGAVSVIKEVMESDDASDGDRLKAARTALELADAFPGRKSEVKFLDERINELTESETDKELARLRAKMGDDDG